jgi:hypothetical protein
VLVVAKIGVVLRWIWSTNPSVHEWLNGVVIDCCWLLQAMAMSLVASTISRLCIGHANLHQIKYADVRWY